MPSLCSKLHQKGMNSMWITFNFDFKVSWQCYCILLGTVSKRVHHMERILEFEAVMAIMSDIVPVWFLSHWFVYTAKQRKKLEVKRPTNWLTVAVMFHLLASPPDFWMWMNNPSTLSQLICIFYWTYADVEYQVDYYSIYWTWRWLLLIPLWNMLEDLWMANSNCFTFYRKQKRARSAFMMPWRSSKMDSISFHWRLFLYSSQYWFCYIQGSYHEVFGGGGWYMGSMCVTSSIEVKTNLCVGNWLHKNCNLSE